MNYAITIIAFLSLASVASASVVILPSLELSPQEVIRIQLSALQKNSADMPSAGIEQTWAFAHPKNRAVTGPIERFEQMLKNKNYQCLLGHKEHRIQEVVVTSKIANYQVLIVSSDDKKFAFFWRLERVTEGSLMGAWMTTGVSTPLRAKDAV